MLKHRVSLLLLVSPLLAIAQDRDFAPLERSWTASLTGGFADTFQLVLGGTYGDGPDFQNRLTVGLNDALRKGDSLSVFGWSTTDMPKATPNWQAGVLYKTSVVKRKMHALSVTGGVQRWLLPMIKTGAIDWMVTGNATFSTSIKGVPLFVSGDSYSLLKSTLPTGTGVYSQIYTHHKLWKGEGLELSLRHGPAYSYSWGFYGAQGNRVFRYNGALLLTSRAFNVEVGYRQQVGLQDPIPSNRYWYCLV